MCQLTHYKMGKLPADGAESDRINGDADINESRVTNGGAPDTTATVSAFIPRHVRNLLHFTKDYFITGRASMISCAVGLR